MGDIHHFERGDGATVFSFNRITGRYQVEGRVTIISAKPDEDTYLVEFDNGDIEERYVDPTQLVKPIPAILATLNAQKRE